MAYVFLFILILMVPSAIAGFLAAPYVPTRKREIGRFLKLAEIKKGDIVYDLGCGDGRLLAAAAKQGARAIGYELSFLNYLFCKLFRRSAEIRLRNFFRGDFHDADVIYMFLSQRAHNKMGKILAGRLKPGARVICYAWPIEGWEAAKIDRQINRLGMFLYITPNYETLLFARHCEEGRSDDAAISAKTGLLRFTSFRSQ